MTEITRISTIIFLLVSFFAPFTPEAKAADEFDKGMVTLSFDDGTKSIFDNGIPILDAAGFKSTQFIISGASECADGGVGCVGYMDTSELQTLYHSGHEIAGHTRTDPCAPSENCSTGIGLTGLPEEELLFEVDGLRLDLLKNVGLPVNTFAYPFGEFDAPLTDKLESAGFVGARTVNLIDAQGQILLNDLATDRYHLFAGQVNGNTPITQDDPLPTGWQENWGYIQSWIDDAIEQDKWLILVLHEIDALCPESGFCTTPEDLQIIVDYLASKSQEDLEVVTISEGLSRMNNHPVTDGQGPVIAQNNITATSTSEEGASVAFSPTVEDEDTGLQSELNTFCTKDEPRYPVSEFPPFGGHPVWGVHYNTVVTSGHVFPVGTTTVNCTAVDSGGNTGMHSFTVTVVEDTQVPDTTPPVIEEHDNVTATATSSGEIAVNYTIPAVSDDSDPNPEIECVPPSGSLFAIGTSTVNCIVTDNSNNTATSSFVVIVTDNRDITSPVITLLGDAEVTIEQGDDYDDAGATAEDDVDGDITDLIIVENPVETATTGTYIITYNVTDSSGNQAVEVTRTVNVVEPDSQGGIPDPTPPPSGGGGGGGGGGSFNPVLPTSPASPTGGQNDENGQVLGEQTGAHPNGTLILDAGTIYRVEAGTKRPFRLAVEFFTHGYKFTDVVPANPADKNLPQGQILKAMESTLVLDTTDGRTVYMIGQDGVKHGFVSETVFRGLGFSFSNLVSLNVSDYNPGTTVSTPNAAHPDGSLVKDSSGTIWWILGGSKYPFPTAEVFASYGLGFSQVVPVNQFDVELPASSAISARQ